MPARQACEGAPKVWLRPGRRRTGGWPGALVVLLVAFLALTLVDLPYLAGASGASIGSQREVSPRARISIRDFEKLSDEALRNIAHLSDPSPVLDHRLSSSLLSAILIPRPPDTPNSKKVRDLLTEVFKNQLGKDERKGRTGWQIETPEFIAATPQGKRKMTNIILTKNPAAPRKLVLAAHYDSKWFPSNSAMSEFIGATDSAAPCAILVDTALALDRLLDERDRKAQSSEPRERIDDTTLQILFLDGEEAYETWTHQDSIYGAKNLVSQWVKEMWQPKVHLSAHQLASRRYEPYSYPTRKIDTIEHFVLLDLLGATEPNIPSFYPSTGWLHSELMDLEKRMKRLDALAPPGTPASKQKGLGSFFSSNEQYGGIEDDHLPFLANGVPILHLIPYPFPHVWHRISDNANALDYPTVHAWAMLMRAFAAEYLGLDVSVAQSARKVSDVIIDHDELVSRISAYRSTVC
ncbi:hypothetical protein K437DRAFT_267543 [Tilletiaria anomala UBC 951]|uniref:Peptide hydrolase n=1 Tax=Tilletiaria anomala (strain ATCC 24038 / CBS 436.72 / UBC 951) TaxID=1037660 RepID=A0A066WCU3_TILAU|nr:uncharacterized protein K437DRAFT_267543 [Tilletiaria anomala UBC 951]KDN48884.1 hypothetical protein K437DRAFT_267543 [Tilletiaria anomala UBC 951]